MIRIINKTPIKAKNIFFRLGLSVILLATIILIDKGLNFDLIHVDLFLIVSVLLIIPIINEAEKDRFLEIAFNDENQTILITHKKIFSEIRQTVLPFAQARVELADRGRRLLRLDKSSRLYFLRGSKELFEISQSKDGLDNDEIRRISEIAEKIPIQIVRL